MQQIHLDRNQVPAFLVGAYTGRKFRVIVTDTVTLHSTFWGGGTRSSYCAADLSGQKISGNITADSAPPGFGVNLNGQKITLSPGYAIREHMIFCGKDMGLRFYIHPENAAKLLPASTAELSDREQCLLSAHCALKSSYGGRKPRVDMMRRHGFTDADIESALASLKEKGFIKKNGAVTTAGRNARTEKYRAY